MSPKSRLFAALLALCCALCVPALAGTRTAAMEGTLSGLSAGYNVVAVSTSAQHATLTDEKGGYRFEGLAAGDYTVYAPLEKGWKLRPGSLWQVTQTGDMVWLTVSLKEGETLALAQADYDRDEQAQEQPAASAGLASLRAAAFNDSNENGERGVYERSIAGVTVEVLDGTGAAVATAVTNAQGEASLTGIAPGEYRLRFTMPDGYLFTVKGGKTGLSSSAVGSVDSAVAETEALAFAAGQTVEAAAAAIPVGSLSGKVFFDSNGNGVMDEGEPGVAGVTVSLRGVKTRTSYSLVTDDTGAYQFPRLRADTYTETAELPDGLIFARYSAVGRDNRSIFTVDREQKASRQFPVGAAEKVSDKNIGVIAAGSVSGTAFLDMNYNGYYDEGEPVYPGVSVELVKNSNDKSVEKLKTGEDGRFQIVNLRGGDYRLRVILPNDGSTFSAVGASADARGNQLAARDGRRENTLPSIQLQNGESRELVIGVARAAEISGTVFVDNNYDGVMTSKDKRMQGLEVVLKNADKVAVAKTTTSAKGKFTLSGIMPGTYALYVERPEDYAFTRRSDGEGGSRVASMADGYGITGEFEVVMGRNIDDMNAGVLLSSSVSGVFFEDLNDNGLQEEGEGGMAGGVVRLNAETGETIAEQAVAPTGAYFFDGVMPGTYTLTYVLPAHAEIARVATGGNTLEGQGAQTVGPAFAIKAGEALQMELVGGVTLGALEGYAFHDANANGVRDKGEALLAGATLTLTPSREDLKAQSVTTGADGLFAIDSLRPSEYTLALSVPDGMIFSSGVGGTSLALPTEAEAELSCPWSVLIDRGEKSLGAVKPCRVDGYVWLDENMNGRQEDSEALLPGLAYELYDETLGRTVKTAVSGENGRVRFENVRPSTYSVRFAIPAQAEPAKDSGSTFAEQSGFMVQTGLSLREGQQTDGVHCGLLSRTSIGGVVQLDERGTRLPQMEMEVRLYQKGGTTPIMTATTAINGIYRFDGLLPGQYEIGVTLPSGMLFLKDDDQRFPAGTTVIHSETDGEGRGATIDLKMARDQLTQDVVLVWPARVGDLAWLDQNQNGLIDGGEPMLPGVTVSLTQDGKTVLTATTNEYGYYELDHVYPGRYVLTAKAYPQLQITSRVDSLPIITSCLTSGDGDKAQSDPFTVESGEVNLNLDLGYTLREGESLPDSVLAAPPVQDWTMLYENMPTK